MTSTDKPVCGLIALTNLSNPCIAVFENAILRGYLHYRNMLCILLSNEREDRLRYTPIQDIQHIRHTSFWLSKCPVHQPGRCVTHQCCPYTVLHIIRTKPFEVSALSAIFVYISWNFSHRWTYLFLKSINSNRQQITRAIQHQISRKLS